MESWHIPYTDAMFMPSSRRARMCKRKADLESVREAQHRAEMAKIRARK